MLTLSDLPQLLGQPACLTVHGLGRGGGETVARQLATLFGLDAARVLSFSAGQGPVLRGISRWRHAGHVLCTAGPRDSVALVWAALTGRRADVYLQVPYARAITWRDPGHAAATTLYLMLVNLLARQVLVNSAVTGQSVRLRRPRVVLPVLREALSNVRKQQTPKPDPPCMPQTLYWVCRLHTERGRGARDTAAMGRLAREVAHRNRVQPGSVRIVHFGDAGEQLKQTLQHQAEGAIEFRGHVSDWQTQVQGVVVFLSRYEGFGLAAFEAAQAGLAVCVNEAFPQELLAAAPSIRRIRSGEPGKGLLEQWHANPAPASGE